MLAATSQTHLSLALYCRFQFWLTLLHGFALSGTGRMSQAAHANLPNAALTRSETDAAEEEDEYEDAAATKTLRPPEAGTVPLTVTTITGAFWSFRITWHKASCLFPRSTIRQKSEDGMRQRLRRGSGPNDEQLLKVTAVIWRPDQIFAKNLASTLTLLPRQLFVQVIHNRGIRANSWM